MVDDEVPGDHQESAGHTTADQTGDRRLHDERRLDVEAGGAHETHDAGLAAPAERRDAHGVDDQHQGDDEHQGHHRAGRPVHAVEETEEVVQDALLVLHGLHALTAVEGGRDDLVLLRVLQLDPVRLLHLVRGEGAGQRRVAELLLVVLVRLVLRLVRHLLDDGHLVEVGHDLLLLVLGHRALGAVGVGLGIALVAEEDRDVDLVVPVALHGADLVAHQQRTAEQSQGQSDRDDDREGHREIAAKTDTDLRDYELGAHGVSLSLSFLVVSAGSRRHRVPGPGRGGPSPAR